MNITGFDCRMDSIREYAKQNNISISEACALYTAAEKSDFHTYIRDRLDHLGIPLELYTKDDHPVRITSDTTVDIGAIDDNLEVFATVNNE